MAAPPVSYASLIVLYMSLAYHDRVIKLFPFFSLLHFTSSLSFSYILKFSLKKYVQMPCLSAFERLYKIYSTILPSIILKHAEKLHKFSD